VSAARVLIVDDDVALLEALPETVRLRMNGIRIDTSASALDALERIEAIEYDAIVTDIKMPGMDGLALLSEIKKRSPRTPTLLITGHGEHDLAVQALRGGAYDFVAKPIDRDYFIASLERAIGLRQLDRQVEEQKLALERHARVLEHVGDGVFLVGEDGIVHLWNQAAEGITGLTSAEVVGRPAAEMIPGWQTIASLVPVERAATAGTGRSETLPVEVEGRELWLSFSAVEFSDGVVYAFRDLTSERVVDALKDEFVATMSHEVRTPLAAIYGASMTLARSDLELAPDDRRRLLDVISNESDRLARIVNEILLANHIDSGRLRLTTEPVQPREIAHAVAESARTYAPDGVRIEVSAPDDLPPLPTDADRLRQVLANLVENAIKYSPDGGNVELSIERMEDRLRFAVRDQGLGIPPSEHERIFTKFYRLDPNLTRGVGGTGLGLYICRELVRRMDGHIWLVSGPGEGSTFFVDLPLGRAPVLGEAEERTAHAAPAA
jgi:two-component system phosphate regulon sensor histidine kinase PhoR